MKNWSSYIKIIIDTFIFYKSDKYIFVYRLKSLLVKNFIQILYIKDLPNRVYLYGYYFLMYILD